MSNNHHNQDKYITSKKSHFLYKKDNHSTILNQGLEYMKNNFNKITSIISSNTKEGFYGILNSNTNMKDRIDNDKANIETTIYDINSHISNYNVSRNNLKQKTIDYLDINNNDNTIRNYNLFINSIPNPIISNYNSCVDTASLNNDMPHDIKFNQAYPNKSTNTTAPETPFNFSSFADAKEACKTWAIDKNKKVFAISKDQGNNKQYNCHIGDNPNTALFSKPTTAYQLVDGTNINSNKGGLFKNGLIGVYSSDTDKMKDIDDSYLLKNLIKTPKPFKIAQFGIPTNNIWMETGWEKNLKRLDGGVFTDKTAHWIWDNPNYNIAPYETKYMYYFYVNDTQKEIPIYVHALVDNVINFTFNGLHTWKNTGGYSGHYYTLPLGLSVFMFKVKNEEGPGGLLLSVTNRNNHDKVLFNSNVSLSPNWAIYDQELDYNKIITKNMEVKRKYYDDYNHGFEKIHPYNICDPLIGGDINQYTIQASYGRNCSNTSVASKMAQYVMVKNRPTPYINGAVSGSWLQIAGLYIYGYENGRLQNLSVKARQPGGEGEIIASSVWEWNWERSGRTARVSTKFEDGPYKNKNNEDAYVVNSLNYVVDGNIATIYHSYGTSPEEYVIVDLGKKYPITKIIYINRADCCQGRADGMTINLYTDYPKLDGSNGILKTPITLTDSMKQEFNV
mgnify:CR=1 FL=1